MSDLKLKPCPKCGSNDLIYGFLENRDEMKIICKKCGILFTIFQTPEKAVKLWNEDYIENNTIREEQKK